MLKKRNKIVTTLVTMAFAFAGATSTTLMVQATDESLTTTKATTVVSETEVGTTVVAEDVTTTSKAAETTTTVTTTSKESKTTTTSSSVSTKTTTTIMPDEVTTVPVEPRAGDRIWINESPMVFWDVDESFKSEITSKIKFDIYIISRYDENRWRVHVPYMNQPDRVLLIPVDYDIEVLAHDGFVLGDLTRDGRVDGFDMILMRRSLFRDFDLDNYSDIDALVERSIDRQLADVNSDKEISIADLVCMQNFLLGRTDTFREVK